ncbi:MAG TPA: nuclear transport factor 2 family protein [Cyclobacteriaceae bacterium]|jgi:hypothetical protein|nr:nuclear transport factor 2 family protein [Cyclobacteriaceae bacterium]
MKLIYLLVFFISTTAFAQSADSAAIRKASADYVEGFYKADAQRVAQGVSPELVKRIVIKDDKGNSMINNMGSSALIFAASKNTNANPQSVITSNEPFRIDVSIYDITADMASVKIKTNKFKFIDYAHLAKVNGEWKVINVLWGFYMK